METIKNIKAIHAFVSVAKYGGYSLAARELKVSKAHISKLVQLLEDQLGQRLFNRSTRIVRLTPLGRKFYEVCLESLEKIERAQSLILDQAQQPQGKLKISLAGAYGEEYVTEMVSDFIKKYPKIQIELVFEERIVDLIKDSYDLAIRVGPLKSSSMIAKQIASRREYICATPDYLKTHGTPKSIADLKKHNCLGSKNSWRFISKNKAQQIPINGNFKSNNGRSILKACLNNLGVCFLPDVYVKTYIESGQLIPVLKSYTQTEIPIWLITPSRKNMSKNIQIFMKEFN